MKKLADWLHYIEQLHPDKIALGLDRIREVAQRLNIMQFHIPVVTVAGTNGKGSCIATLESILLKSGLKVGAYTSPHLLSFTERIRLSGQEIDDTELAKALDQVEQARQHIPLTYFEFTTLATLLLFQKAELDILLLEIGMGGRLDAVNIIDPTIAIITTIALDHVEWLGHSRESIGFEKAGILRFNTPIICGDFLPPHSIVEKARILKAPLYLQNEHYHYRVDQQLWHWKTSDWNLENLPLPLLPIQNVATALMAVQLLKQQFDITTDVIYQAIAEVKMPGRFQHHQNNIILDVGHNPAAAHWLKAKLCTLASNGNTHAIVGMLADKDIENTLKPLRDIVQHWHVCDLSVERAASSKLLQEKLRSIGVDDSHAYQSIASAIQQVSAQKNSDDRILIFGSFHTVANALQYLNASQIT